MSVTPAAPVPEAAGREPKTDFSFIDCDIFDGRIGVPSYPVELVGDEVQIVLTA